MTIDGERKLYIENPENLPTVLQNLLQYLYLHYTCETKFFAQIVTVSYSDRPKGRQR